MLLQAVTDYVTVIRSIARNIAYRSQAQNANKRFIQAIY
ncbi:hypothetical protein BN1221_03023 [Brenneria goodwinii]|uniref:Uncharacterized protein n=1 Tax=Brenneria goodwinii TaxID=1109412 RepID=A0A0G4JXA3_9GAMM|nr:hypothetical protein BN1221_03023 [Brenneria goodwinii]